MTEQEREHRWGELRRKISALADQRYRLRSWDAIETLDKQVGEYRRELAELEKAMEAAK